jgi:hypothetical protein
MIIIVSGFAQENVQDTSKVYKKRVLENAEIDFLTSLYLQDGDNAAVTGGIGTEKLSNITPTLVISVPLNDDDIIKIDGGISAYTSASSSNLNPFTGASSGEGEEDDDDKNFTEDAVPITGSPWVESSGASKSDVLTHATVTYSHSSDNRNTIWSGNLSFSSEYDYVSFGFGGGLAKLFNEKNTEIGLKAKVYLDKWKPEFPTELISYFEADQNLNNGFFSGVDILDENGNIIDKNGTVVWSPWKPTVLDTKNRNSYSLSFSFSQIIGRNAQFSIFIDVVQQTGWLANPMQRVYFADRANYYIGNAANIPNYTSPTNTDVFRLADDIERLPDMRFKTPIGARFNYYINEIITLRTYYRYYTDDWGIYSHTASLEIPVKISSRFTIYPSYRFYTQTTADYFAPFNEHLTTDEFYTSDYDLSELDSQQYGFGISYTDIFTKGHIWKLRIKNIDLKYSHYQRSTGLNANIVSAGIRFVFE